MPKLLARLRVQAISRTLCTGFCTCPYQGLRPCDQYVNQGLGPLQDLGQVEAEAALGGRRCRRVASVRLQTHHLCAGIPHELGQLDVSHLLGDAVLKLASQPLLGLVELSSGAVGTADAALPAPVAAGLLVLGIAAHRGQALTSLLHAHIASGDVLLEGREQLLEGRVVVAEQGRLGDAAGVHGVEHDVLALVEAAVHLKDGQHVAGLGILVRLGSVEGAVVNHGNAVLNLEASKQALAVAEVGLWGDLAGQLCGVVGDGADNDHAGLGLGLAAVLLNRVQQQVEHEEVCQVDDTHALLKAILGDDGLRAHAVDSQGACTRHVEAQTELLRVLQHGVVDGSIAQHAVKARCTTQQGRLGQFSAELAHAGQATQVYLLDGVAARGELQGLGHALHLGTVPHSANDVPVASLDQNLGSVQAQTR
mmetsp:Transcript_36283/g.80754  ORF Transcript_36283/g.80754 Transcript_36283/m.80754 type:complete len:422 (+) Transcript_36283:895-2160(+)